VLFALGHPPALVGLLLGFVVGVFAAGFVQSRSPSARLRGRARFTRFVDPFGAIAAALGGIGWSVQPDIGRWRRGPARRRAILRCLAVPLIHLVLAAIGYGVLIAIGHRTVAAMPPRVVLYGLGGGVSFIDMTLLGFGVVNLTMALLHVMPVPPMALGRIIALLAPPSSGWQRAEHELVDNNWGIGILLALSLPIFSGVAVSATLTSMIAQPILNAVAGIGSA
jgi:hypothetical protein